MLFGGEHNVWTVIEISTKWRNRVSLTKWFEAFKLSYKYLSEIESYEPRRMSILKRLLIAPVGVSGLQRLCYYRTPVPTQTHPSFLLLRGSSFPVEEKGSYSCPPESGSSSSEWVLDAGWNASCLHIYIFPISPFIRCAFSHVRAEMEFFLSLSLRIPLTSICYSPLPMVNK